MQTYRYTDTPTAADIDAATKLKLIPSGVRIYADRADYGARGGGPNPAPQNGNPKHWCYPSARWNIGRAGLWFVFLDGWEPTNALTPGQTIDNRQPDMGLTNRETWGILSNPNFYSTNSSSILLTPRFEYRFIGNEELMRLSIGESPAENASPVPVAFLFEDEVGPIDWLTPDGKSENRPTGYKFRSTFPSDIGMCVVGGGMEAFRISEWVTPVAAGGQTFRGYDDADQLEFLQSTIAEPGSDASRAAKIRKFYER